MYSVYQGGLIYLWYGTDPSTDHTVTLDPSELLIKIRDGRVGYYRGFHKYRTRQDRNVEGGTLAHI